ncbi:DNA repair protein RecO [Catenovulum sp. 2E275]|uniref:DNA repair protein RecO n=1 Tax=Catenovulum sp. 2E275 TaxID=2980497 RepID=UPI0021CF9A78|nr:DNA repair protein RecO [Catenovulum sp. 2E275]MCU4675946.1 DNA repair protein RecO [Catenovulum sp. 2E275]
MVTNNLQRAVVLHAKPHRENTRICQLLTEQDGRITVIARHSKNQDELTPFNLYLISAVQAQGDLFFLRSSELLTRLDTLTGPRLYSGLYINELIAKLLHQVLQPQECVNWYLACISQLLDESAQLEPCLRNFELDLINELGLAPDYFHCAETNERLIDQTLYGFDPETGWFPAALYSHLTSPKLTGKQVKAIGRRDWQDQQTLKQTKLFMRWWLDILLAGRPLKSRSLFKRGA